MDRAVAGFGDPAMFITALVARWRWESRSIDWVACGHPLPCLVPADGPPREIEAFAFPPLGIGDPSRLASARTELQVGDRLVFFSDGVVERRTLTGRLGVAGFLEHVGQVADPSAASLLTHIVSHVSGLHETPLDDDATVLVLRVLDDPAHEPSTDAPELTDAAEPA